jgi:hypothetical protein
MSVVDIVGNSGNPPPMECKKAKKSKKSCYSCRPRELCDRCGRHNEVCDRCSKGLVVTNIFGTMICEPCDEEVYEGYEKGAKDPYYYGVRWQQTV